MPVNQQPIRPTSRERVYDVIDGERDYQDNGEGNAKRHPGRPPMTPGEYILCMEMTLAKARMAWYHPEGGEACLHYIRKTAALGVNAMELHGAPPREWHVPASAGITGEMHATASLDTFAPRAAAEPLPSTPVPAVPSAS